VTKPQWTPDPWILDHRDEIRMNCFGGDVRNGHPVMDLASCSGPRTGYDEAKANARLIAAAPDLYRELLRLVMENPLLLERKGIREALQKATGTGQQHECETCSRILSSEMLHPRTHMTERTFAMRGEPSGECPACGGATFPKSTVEIHGH
jgi:hypothetical protein